MNDIPGADARRREQERIRKEYPDLYYYAVGVALVVALMIAGYALFPDRDGYLTNLFTEAASVAVTLLVLNRMAEARAIRRYKQDLIFRMGSQSNERAVQAVEDLGRHGWLRDGSLREVRLPYANLSKARLWSAKLSNATLRGAILTNAILWDADLSNADLRHAELFNAQLRSVTLKGEKLKGANLTGANLTGANLKDANLKDAILEGATLPNGDTWHPGYDMSIFTDPPDDAAEKLV